MENHQPRIACLFPGQGSQFVGMGRDWYDQTEIGRALFDRADAVLGFPLSRICFDGPEEELKKTHHAQPGLFTCSVIAFEFLKSRGVTPAVVAGHSLGEYSALYAAGVMDLATGLSLVRARGAAMSEAAEARPGAMAAVLGLDTAQIEAVCREAAGVGIVQAANFNASTQTVISGERAAVERAGELAKAAGARRVIPLPVHGAFHSPLMEPAVAKMESALAAAELADPRIPFLANVTGDFLNDAGAVRRSLAQQITHCVRWADIMSKIAAMSPDVVIEVGPGKVLSGLWRQSGSPVSCAPCGTVAEAETLINRLQ
ncbi:MAG: ACP S-malonyltransferase [Candidatus Sumerlaeia bacterium]|nr:ACP S-malonyltransferase [Candidatus Sumerlaeia bacterium]